MGVGETMGRDEEGVGGSRGEGTEGKGEDMRQD